MPLELLLAMQAAGMVVDYLGMSNQHNMMKMGNKLQKAGLEADLQMTKLASEDATLQSLKELRQNIGSQIAVYGARGTSTAGGSALLNLNTSVGTFNADERMRKLNLLSRTNALKGEYAMSQIQNNTELNKQWNSFIGRSVKRFGTAYYFANNPKTSSYGLTNIE